jgi:hypothetical protein
MSGNVEPLGALVEPSLVSVARSASSPRPLLDFFAAAFFGGFGFSPRLAASFPRPSAYLRRAPHHKWSTSQ